MIRVKRGGEKETDAARGLHDAGGFGARLFRKAFGDERGAGGLLAADAQAGEEAEDRQFRPAIGDAA